MCKNRPGLTKRSTGETRQRAKTTGEQREEHIYVVSHERASETRIG